MAKYYTNIILMQYLNHLQLHTAPDLSYKIQLKKIENAQTSMRIHLTAEMTVQWLYIRLPLDSKALKCWSR